MKLATGKLMKVLFSAVLMVSLIPLMGSSGCRRDSYYSGFDFGFGYLPSWGGYDYYEAGYQETYFDTGFYYDEGYYDGGWYDDWWWKNKNADKSAGARTVK